MWFVWMMGLWACQVGGSGRPHEDTTAPSGGEDLVACEPSSFLTLELAQQGPYGLSEGAPLWFGLPPQGGVPYAPFRLRLEGLNFPEQGSSVSVVATDVDTGERLGDIELLHRFICSNVGGDAGRHVAGEIHLRFWDYRLKELDGRTAEVVATVSDGPNEPAVARYTGPLTRFPEDE